MPKMGGRAVKFVNRGAAGLLNKTTRVDGNEEAPPKSNGKPNNIAAPLRSLAVAIDSLTPDPDNARQHGERNLEAIKDSLRSYGQLKALVVRRKGLVVIAGNGTLLAAKELGWTKIAATVVEMDAIQAAGYGLADNRTAELATWNLEVVERLSRLIGAAGVDQPGWTAAELEVLRKGSWVEPPADFPEVDESIETEHTCPRCGYRFSGGEVSAKESGDGDDSQEES